MGIVISIDAGTTGVRSFAVDEAGTPLGFAYREFTQFFPQPGWVEHDPEEIYSNVVHCLNEVCERNKLSATNVRSIGITNQRETTVAFDRATGKHFHNAIVWLDQRTSGVVEKMLAKNGGNADAYREDCGLPINTYFSAQKMKWLLENVDGLSSQENLIMGTIDTYLVARLSQCEHLVTDSTNASRTMLMDINTLEWSPKMLKEYDIQEKWLPKIIKESSASFGQVKDA